MVVKLIIILRNSFNVRFVKRVGYLMEGIKRIEESLKEEAEDEREEILKEANQKAEEIKSEARREADAKSDKIIEEGKREAKSIVKKILSNARMKARRKKLEFKDEMCQRVFEEAKDKLLELKENQEKYKEILKKLIKEGGLAVGGGDLEVLVSKSEDLLTQELIEEIGREISEETGKDTQLTLKKELKGKTGGAIVRRSDGSMQSDNTFEARLERMRDSLRTEVTKILFENE